MRHIEFSVENLVLTEINKHKAGLPPVIYGTDYPTPDGTHIRDCVDVRNIAQAHLAAADSRATLPLAMNVRTGRGGSVREVIKLVCEAAGRPEVIAVKNVSLAGHPAFLCADVSLIQRDLSCTSLYTLEATTKNLY